MYARHLTPETQTSTRKGRPQRRLASITAVAVVALSAAACSEPGGEPTGTSARADVYTSDRPARTVEQPPEVVGPPPARPTVDDTIDSVDGPRSFTYAEAETAFVARDYEEAERRFESYVGTVPENPWGHYMLGLSAWKTGNLTTAETAFRAAIAIDPNHAKSHVNLGRVLIEDERYEDAIAQLDIALGIEAVPTEAYRVLGNALLGTGEVDKAAEQYEFALALDPEDSWSMNNLGLAMIRAAEFEAALSPLARATQIDGANPTFLNNLGVALERSGHSGQALATYRDALSADPTYEKAAVSLARIEGVAEAGSARGSDALAYGERESETESGADLEALAAEFVRRIDGFRTMALADPEPEVPASVDEPGSE